MQVSRQKSQNMEPSHDMQEGQDAIELLIHQHREVDELFEQLENTSQKSYRTKEKIAQKIAEKVLFHTNLEQKIFYPEAREFMPGMVLESLEEHDIIKVSLKRLLGTKSNDLTFQAKTTVLKELIEHHVKEEENELFPQMREQCKQDELKDLGARISAEIQREHAGGERGNITKMRPRSFTTKKRKMA